MTDEFEADEWSDFKRSCVRRYLRYVVYLKHRVERHNEEIAEMRELADGLKGIDYSRDIVGTSPTADTMLNTIISINEKIEKGMADVNEYVDALDNLTHTLDGMDNQLNARIVMMHYVKQMEYEDVAKALRREGSPWSVSSIKRFAAMGLDELYYLMPQEWRVPAHPAL